MSKDCKTHGPGCEVCEEAFDWVEEYNESYDEFTKPGSRSLSPATIQVQYLTSDFYNSEEIRAMGIECGERCMIHKQNIIVNPSKLKLGDDVRIDGYCTISCGSGITIGSNVHIAGYVTLMGAAGIEVGSFVSIASGAKVFSASDDLMGRGLVGPCVPNSHRHVHSGKVTLGAHSVLAVNTVVMPGANLSYGSTLLPFSVLMKGDLHKGCVLQGVPAKVIKNKIEGFLDKCKKADSEGL